MIRRPPKSPPFPSPPLFRSLLKFSHLLRLSAEQRFHLREPRLKTRHLRTHAGLDPPRGVELCRSEEHTSELQSQSNLVCRLLLEKKKGPYIHAVLPRAQHLD